MKVSAENFKVIPVKKAVIFYFIFIVIAFLSYQILKNSISQNHILWDLLAMSSYILMACIGVGSLFYGRKILKSRQTPPPNTWVLSNWQIIGGKKAYRAGWLVIFCGVFIAFSSIYQLIVYIKYLV